LQTVVCVYNYVIVFWLFGFCCFLANKVAGGQRRQQLYLAHPIGEQQRIKQQDGNILV
jgi:hypothetical protein